jgi:hypothetical protein
MRPCVLAALLLMGITLPEIGTAQIVYQPEPRPFVTAANAPWQINGEPIFHAGSFFFPSGPTVSFDPNLMRRVGDYQGVPLYVDTTQEAGRVVYVPVSGGWMKPYVVRRPGVGGAAAPPLLSGFDPFVTMNPLRDVPPALALQQIATGPVGITGSSSCPCPAATAGTTAPAPPLAVAPTAVQTVPPPSRSSGISIAFQGAQWANAGRPVTYAPDRFVPIGDYHGFPVYRAMTGDADTIYVTLVPDGPLAPYTRR